MTAYRRRFYRITATALVGAMGITGLSATASMATPPPATSVSGSSAAAVTPGIAAGAGLATAGSASAQIPSPHGPDAVAGSATTFGIVGVVIKAIKSIPALWKAAVNKVKAGYAAFKSWWENSVPQWIKNLLTGVTIYDIYNEIRNELGL